eukprot:1463583-Amphidinium_carterae.2
MLRPRAPMRLHQHDYDPKLPTEQTHGLTRTIDVLGCSCVSHADGSLLYALCSVCQECRHKACTTKTSKILGTESEEWPSTCSLNQTWKPGAYNQ